MVLQLMGPILSMREPYVWDIVKEIFLMEIVFNVLGIGLPIKILNIINVTHTIVLANHNFIALDVIIDFSSLENKGYAEQSFV